MELEYDNDLGYPELESKEEWDLALAEKVQSQGHLQRSVSAASRTLNAVQGQVS